MNIGLDFGTTNSIISYFDKKENDVVSHRLGGVNSSNYIPSIVSIGDDGTLIGVDAKNDIDNESSEVYTKFKILLHLDDKQLLDKYGYSNKKPSEVTKVYLEMLLEKFKEDNQVDKIDSLVLTVPEIWISNNLGSRLKIKEIVESLNITPKLVSEPVSAGAYFLFNYNDREEKFFKGYILVFDYGGGTLDIALLDTKDEHIKILERVGKGDNESLSGSAGVAYDEKIIHSVVKERKGLLLSKNDKNYYTLLADFEREKITKSKKIELMISNYLKDNSLNNKAIFSITYVSSRKSATVIEFFPSDFVDTFKSFKDEIDIELGKIKTYCQKNKIDIENSNSFRVIMVGGFSSFYLSQKAVLDFFNANSEDKRFQSYFKAEDNALAISKGATLIAEKLVNIHETYPLTIRLLMKEKNKYDFLEDSSFIMFSKGDTIENHKPIFLDGTITKPGDIIFEFDYEDGQNVFKHKIEKGMKSLFPNYEEKNNKWNIGFSIDDNNFIHAHIEDKNKNKNKIELGNLINEFKNAIIYNKK